VIVGARLLVADPDVGDRAVQALRHEGFTVSLARCGADALLEVGSSAPDAMLLAPHLEDLAVHDLVAAVRRRSPMPILLGLDAEPDLVSVGEALLTGATGTVARPYVAHEVVTKVAMSLPASQARAPLELGPLRLEPQAFKVVLDGVDLPRMGLKEFRLLQVLLQRAECVVSHVDLRRALSGADQRPLSQNAIAVYVRRVRARLRPPVRLETIRGVGYRLTLDAGPGAPSRVTAGGRGAGSSR
jgi:DNA-binding response OmpR family regulator